MIEKNINVSEYQAKKIAAASKKGGSVSIRLGYNQIAGGGKHKVSLTEAQVKKLEKSKDQKKGVVLDLSNNQIKTGGFLPALLAAFPLISSILGAAGGVGGVAGGVSAIVNAVKNAKHQNAVEEETKRHNQEMEKLALAKLKVGSGLKKKKKK
jgi:hypothetical protein